ncbi:MAG TPA: hypothetical protein VMS08_05040 [Candidatus Saccharimonadia bacterium]|nr:hypothetical protein [Candidatus Saccharimonadia bacterium]
MPQVEYPRRRRKKLKLAVTLAGAGVVAFAIIVSSLMLVTPVKALAATNELPVPADDSSGMSLAVGQSFTGAIINAQDDWIKLYFNASSVGNGTIDIYNAPFDCASGSDFVRPLGGCPAGLSDVADHQMLYSFYATDANEDIGPLLYTMDGQTGKEVGTGTNLATVQTDGWSTGIPIPVGNTISTLTGYKVVLMRAYYATPLPGGLTSRLHAFLVRTTSAQNALGYWAQAGAAGNGSPPPTGQYTIHYLGDTRVNFDIQSTSYEFAPPCSMTAPELASLRWYDADNSQDPNPGQDGSEPEWHDIPINFDFYEQAPGSAVLVLVKHVDGTTVPIIGGSGAYEEYTFTAQPGYRYKWVWRDIDGPVQVTPGGNIGAANNVEMWLPFDSINYGIACFNYHSTVAPSDGKTNNQQLDFSNPADLDVKFWIGAQNIGGGAGPIAHTVPVVTATVHPGVWITPDGTGPSDINRAIPGFTILPGHPAAFGYKLNPLTPSGTKLCFSDTIQPHTQIGDPPFPSDNQICYTVLNDLRFPSVVAANSDIHAGGGLCGQTQSNGEVEGSQTGVSLGQYVVAASQPAGINNFGSNGVVSGSPSDTLRLGSTGDYAQTCREDLVGAAQAFYNAGVGVTVISGSQDLGTLSAQPGSGVFFSAGGTLKLSGTVSKKMTIVALGGGTVEIDGNIQLGGSATLAADAPSLGILSSGDIDIDNTVTRVDAYMFADGSIDTCIQGVVNPSACGSTLLVNGFLMAHDIAFQRLGPNGTIGAQIGEDIVMDPQIYLNPPIFFDGSVDNTPIEGEGEQQPLF